MQAEYVQIREQLEDLTAQGTISEYIKCSIIDMSNKIAANIAKKHDPVREGVKMVMGGKILDYEAKDILRKGIAQGEKTGFAQGQKIGEEKGEKRGEDKLSRLIEKLITDNRQQDILKVAQNEEFRKKLYAEYSII